MFKERSLMPSTFLNQFLGVACLFCQVNNININCDEMTRINIESG